MSRRTTGACGAALCLALLGCTDLKAGKPRPDGGSDASIDDGRGGSGVNRSDRDGGVNEPADRDGGQDRGQDGGPSDHADDPAAIAGGGLLLQCDAKASACVAGSLVSGGADIGHAGSATLPGGGTVTLSDDGFELGATECDASGKLCVTGGITP
jgi:hypothetical protein